MSEISHLSVSTTIAINSWFDDQALEKGLRLLPDAEGLIFRHVAGVCFPATSETIATLFFAVNQRIRQGFTIKEAHCSRCGPVRKSGPYCGHIAAAAIFAMPDTARHDGHPFPLPLVFTNSVWSSLAAHLFERYESRGPLLIRADGERLFLDLPDGGQSRFCATLPLGLFHQLLSLFPHRLSWFGNKKMPQAADAQAVIALRDSLFRLSASKTECDLNELGRQSRGQLKESSIWFWLMRNFAAMLPESALTFSHNKNGDFFLQAADKDDSTMFSLRLEQDYSATLLKNLGKHLENFIFLDPAREFTRVIGNDDGSLLVTPCLRLADGRIFSQEELAKCRFDNLFFLAGKGFVPLIRQPDHEAIRSERKKPLTLFDCAQPQGVPGRPFTIANSDVASLLAERHDTFYCRDNEIDSAILHLELREMPDQLELCSSHEDDNWYYISGHYGVGNLQISLADLLTARTNGLDYLPGSGLKLAGTSLDWFYNLGRERIWHRDGEPAGIKVSGWELLHLTAQIDKVVLPEKDSLAHIRSLVNTDSWQDETRLPDRPDHLRDYQVNGMAWLYSLYRHKLGGILADDMGLGKTHQALALLWLIARKNPNRNFLIVCPASVAPHWAMKIKDFYGEFSFDFFHGSGRNFDSKTQITITTYGLIGRDKALTECSFDVIIFDEIQHLKNKKTIMHQAALDLDGFIKIGLTGTPLENSVIDLKNILDICLPGLLGSDEYFKKRYVREVSAKENKKRLAELALRVSPFLLRRDRGQVLSELPEVIEDIHTCELSDDQIRFYRQAIGERGALLDQLNDENSNISYMDILALITMLKQICDHPALIDDESENSEYESGKWDLFVELLGECLASGMKVVVFSQYTRMLDIIEEYLEEEKVGYGSLRGNMSISKRAAMIESFQNSSDCRVFCASLLAGGVGIDLTAAQAVIHYDRWWNAAREDQATSRVHRMGQKHVVQVFKLITVGTLEEKIHRMITAKRDLVGLLIKSDDANMIKKLRRKDLQDLLRWEG
ncbi:MAG: DEAD/DEAH box helicase [Desulfobulbaceae bacterium]|nr:DEAD/DEAH box helicase [Desulfobulbaceae bacterium]